MAENMDLSPYRPKGTRERLLNLNSHNGTTISMETRPCDFNIR